jgi:capsular polysaccharide biosynthesis protein
MLLREVDNSQKLFEQVTARSSQSSIESQTNQTNVSSLSEARVPNQASAPRVLVNTALGSILGLALAVMAALGVEGVDRRLRLPADIADALGLPIVGDIPGPTRRLLGPASGSAMEKRLLDTPAAAGRAV